MQPPQSPPLNLDGWQSARSTAVCRPLASPLSTRSLALVCRRARQTSFGTYSRLFCVLPHCQLPRCQIGSSHSRETQTEHVRVTALLPASRAAQLPERNDSSFVSSPESPCLQVFQVDLDHMSLRVGDEEVPNKRGDTRSISKLFLRSPRSIFCPELWKLAPTTASPKFLCTQVELS